MLYLAIISKGENLDPLHIELMGASTKDAKSGSTIGHMGLGLKQALVLAHKLGMQPVVASNDEQGKYLLRLHTHIERPKSASPIPVVYLRYVRESSPEEFSVFLSIDDVDPINDQQLFLREGKRWCAVEAFQKFNQCIDDDKNRVRAVLAEFLANAYDADKDYKILIGSYMHLSIESGVVVNLAIPEEYATDFYTIINQTHRYFKFRVDDFRSMSLLEYSGVGAIYPKSEEGVSRLFVSGVLAHCSRADNFTTVFDYDVYSRELVSSDRKLSDHNKYRKQLGAVLGNLQDEIMIERILRGIIEQRAKLEEESLCYVELTAKTKVLWMNALYLVYDTTKIALGGEDVYVDSVVEQNYEHIVLRNLSRALADFLERLGIPKTSKVFQSVDYEILPVEQLDGESRKLFERAKFILHHFFPASKNVPITVLFSPLGEHETKMGIAGHDQKTRYNEICIITVFRHRFTEMKLRPILKTLIHEYRHCVTKVNDFTYKFIHAAEDTILDLIDAHMKLNRMGALD